jgi:hypothetical protein
LRWRKKHVAVVDKVLFHRWVRPVVAVAERVVVAEEGEQLHLLLLNKVAVAVM